MQATEVIFDIHFNNELDKIIGENSSSHFFIIADENTHELCWPLISDRFIEIPDIDIIEIPAGESSKSIEIVGGIWQTLIEMGADRSSIIINLGGGVVSDIGGFIAASYKRGLKYYNIPTSLLGMIDAAHGGKTAINFEDIKNNIGFFYPPEKVLIHTHFLETLSLSHLESGFGELLKHGLIEGDQLWKDIKDIDINHLKSDILSKPEIIEKAVRIKTNIVELDPYEQNVRKQLNLGHTIGHVLEAMSLGDETKLMHGHSVAAGIIIEAFISNQKAGLSKDELNEISRTVSPFARPEKISLSNEERFAHLLAHDKKNLHKSINFSLLNSIGSVHHDQLLEIDEVMILLKEAITYYNQL